MRVGYHLPMLLLALQTTTARRAARAGLRRLNEALWWERRFQALREPKVRGPVPYDPAVQQQLIVDLRKQGFELRDLDPAPDAYAEYLERARYERFPRYYGGGAAPDFHEKALEHYLAAELLQLRPDDVYIDIANAGSPAPDIYAELYGCTAYRQDLDYPAGIHGRTIGGDAAAMPLPDGFATKMALHCSFEHFEGDADMRFITEAARVLRPGGRLCILPLYLYRIYAAQTDPAVISPARQRFDDGALLHAARGWGERHARFYDVPQFTRRVRDNLGSLDLSIYVVRDPGAIAPGCHVKFVALLEKPQ